MEYPAIDHTAVEPGAALVTLVEPHRGHEVAYNRWYERDHFYAGCLIGPLWFAGRRFVATRPLKDLRFPDPTPAIAELRAGSYLAVYWILAGHEADAIAWGTTQVRWLHEAGRMFEHRDHVHTLMYVHRWAVGRDPDGVPAALALDHPFSGLVVLMVDPHDDVPPRELSGWLRDEALPATMAGTPWALTNGLTPIPLPPDAPVSQAPAPGQDRRLLLLGHLDADPRTCWEEVVVPFAERVRAAGRGTVSLAAPFIPTVPGTDTYTDELW
jgi:hypothetical protein